MITVMTALATVFLGKGIGATDWGTGLKQLEPLVVLGRSHPPFLRKKR